MSFQSVETRHAREREQTLRGLMNLDRRSFVKASAAAGAAVMARGLAFPQSFQPLAIQPPADVEGRVEPFRIAYISDTHLYAEHVTDRFIRSLLRAVDDVNALDPQPDFVLFGGDLAQLGSPEEFELGAQILSELQAPLKMVVGEHDWYLDLGSAWRERFGADFYSFDHKGVHFVVLNSVLEDDFWSAPELTPEQRMFAAASLNNDSAGNFRVGTAQRAWLQADLARYSDDTPLVVFSHAPLYQYYRPWNFWTEDAPEVQALLRRFDRATVVHGHTHQLLTNRIDNIHFHGLLSTAWPWPYAPEGLPELTVQLDPHAPDNPDAARGHGELAMHPDGLVDKIHRLWNRNPVTVERTYLASGGRTARPQVDAEPI